jgi:hypothetical protein
MCGRLFPGIVGSNPAGGTDVCLSGNLCVVLYRSLRRADPLSRGTLRSVCVLLRAINSNPLQLQRVSIRGQSEE